MFRIHVKRARQFTTALVVCAFLCCSPGVAAPAPGPNPCGADHSPATDPAGSAPADQTTLATGSPLPAGLSDAEFKRTDPAGFRAVMLERAAIERSLKTKAHAALAAKGIPYGNALTADRIEEAELAASAVSPYCYLKFALVQGASDWSYNGYKGTLYFLCGVYSPTVDIYKWTTYPFPAISGSNRPEDQARVNYGPIPEYTYDFGFMYGAFRGYEADSRDAFYPGKWRLDPWTGAPYGRSCLETHGGRNGSYFRPTGGCVRITPTSIATLKSLYDSKMANKRDRASAHLYVNY